jgi:hypothetical protein
VVLPIDTGNFAGKNAPEGVVVLPLDVASEVSILKEAVVKVESAVMGAGIDIMVHNAAYARPVGFLPVSFALRVYPSNRKKLA